MHDPGRRTEEPGLETEETQHHDPEPRDWVARLKIRDPGPKTSRSTTQNIEPGTSGSIQIT